MLSKLPVFQAVNTWCPNFRTLTIYVTSSLLLVNPVLNCRYSLFEMEYEEQGQRKQGLMISPYRDIYESDNIKIYNIGYKLFYVNKINKK